MERKHGKIRILFTIPNFHTAGSGKALLNIASRLNKKYFEPHIACLHSRGEYFNVVNESGIPIHIFQFTASMSRRINGLYKCWEISRLMKKINPHIMHSFHYAADYSEALAARMAGIPWIFTKKNMSWGRKSKNSWRLRSALAHHIIIQNTDMKEKFYPSVLKTTLIPRGISLPEFLAVDPKVLSFEDIGIPANSKVIMTVANLVPVKGIEYLINSFSRISYNKKSLYLVIIGDIDNDYGAKLIKNTSEKNNSEKVLFLGKRNDVSSLLQLAHVFVLPTLNKNRKEGSPVALLEAMASSIPVLASNVPGSRDILNELPNQLFLSGSNSSLLEKLQWVLHLNKDIRNQLIKDQLGIIRNKYLIETEVINHENVYSECLNH